MTLYSTIAQRASSSMPRRDGRVSPRRGWRSTSTLDVARPRIIDVLSRLVSARGAPSFLRHDNGPEFVSEALLSWIVARGIGTALIEPGEPGGSASRRASTAPQPTRSPAPPPPPPPPQDAAVCGPSRPGPLHNPLRKEHMHEARDAISS